MASQAIPNVGLFARLEAKTGLRRTEIEPLDILAAKLPGRRR